MVHVAINGFGRIGKTFLRVWLNDPQARKKFDVVAINVGRSDPKAAAFGFTYDTLMGRFKQPVRYEKGYLLVGDYRIKIISELDASALPWKDLHIDWVVDATGKYTKASEAQKHLQAGARNVLITAPAHGEDITIIPGVNDRLFDTAKHHIVSLGSCTTNALAPLLFVINREFGIESAAMTTIHAYTNTQALLDVDATTKDLRRMRAAALNIVPTTTGAMEVIGRIMPELSGKIVGTSIRVPVAKVSLIDLTVRVKKSVTLAVINDAFKTYSRNELSGILQISDEPLVSSDYSGSDYSVVVDAQMTNVVDDMIKVFGWYDNEWGYSERLKDFLAGN